MPDAARPEPVGTLSQRGAPEAAVCQTVESVTVASCSKEIVMERLLISNIAPGTGDEELTALVKKHAPELNCFRIDRIEGDGSRSAALLSFTHESLDLMSTPTVQNSRDPIVPVLERLRDLSRRLNGMYWKGRVLESSTTVFGK
jgi:hypothetical protein